MSKEAGTIEWSGNAEIEEYDCVWIISTSAGKHVQILFTHLSLPDTTCGNDYLKVSGIQRKTIWEVWHNFRIESRLGCMKGALRIVLYEP